ncbi:MAG: glycerol dehydrogenase [Eubacterium sp.]|nr:glycerol dehydrogenase [Candidatus Colimonas fimequi]
MVNSTTRAFGSPFRYIQGPDEFNNLAEYASQYGTKLFVLIDGFLFDELSARLADIFADSDCQVVCETFGGECSEAEVQRVTSLVRSAGANIIAGVGGGKTLDTAKLVAANESMPTFILPTSASTDAPTSSLSVVYNEKGEHLYSKSHKRGSDLILVDTKIIAKAPVRLFAAGIGDALSTYYEARANAQSDTANYIGKGYRRTLAAMAIAEKCRDILFENGVRAVNDIKAGALTEAVENVIEANILLSGLGFENTGCAGAHSVHTGIHEIPGTNKYFHGEMVAFGIVFQLVLENDREDELDEVLDLLTTVGLPVTLKQIGVDPTPENIAIIADRICDGNSGVEAEPFLINYDTVYNALISADAIGREWLGEE